MSSRPKRMPSLKHGIRGCVTQELGRAYAEPVTDPDLRLEQAVGREVLSERAPREILRGELPAPVFVVLGGIGIDGLVRTTVRGKVGLFIAFEVE